MEWNGRRRNNKKSKLVIRRVQIEKAKQNCFVSITVQIQTCVSHLKRRNCPPKLLYLDFFYFLRKLKVSRSISITDFNKCCIHILKNTFRVRARNFMRRKEIGHLDVPNFGSQPCDMIIIVCLLNFIAGTC